MEIRGTVSGVNANFQSGVFTTLTASAGSITASSITVSGSPVLTTANVTVSGSPVLTTASTVMPTDIDFPSGATVSGSAIITTASNHVATVTASGTTLGGPLTVQTLGNVVWLRFAALGQGSLLTVSGHLPGTVYAAEAVNHAMTTSETDFTNLTGMVLNPPPDGVRQYKASWTISLNPSTVSTNYWITMYAGQNGNKSDTFIANWYNTSAGSNSPETQTVYGFRFTPAVNQPKVGFSYHGGSVSVTISGAVTTAEIMEVSV